MTDVAERGEADPDVLIVGAGPAGLSAAAVLAGHGHRVTVLDREGEAGGVPRHCTHSPYGLREYRRLMTGPRYARRLAETARQAGATIRTRINVTALLPGPRVEVTSDDGPAVLTARAVLLATGARETTRAERLIGGTKPQGVLSTGALQLLLEQGQKPFYRPVILGTELVAYSALLSCRLAGIKPVAMVEPSDRPTARWPTSLFPRLLGVPLLTGTGIARIDGRCHVTAVELDDGQVLQTDGLIVTGRFQPDAPLLARGPVRADPLTGGPEIDQYGRCTEPGYFAAGNLLRAVETAGWSWAEGRDVGEAIHAHLTGTLPADPGRRIGRTGPISAMVPQRIAPGPAGIGLDMLQLRVGAPVRGTVGLTVGGNSIASRRIDTGPERRILLPLPPAGVATEVCLTVKGST